MPTLTIELPEDAYQDALSFSEAERTRIVIKALATFLSKPESDDPTTEEDIVAIRESFADAAAGRVIDGDTLFAELRARRKTKAEAPLSEKEVVSY